MNIKHRRKQKDWQTVNIRNHQLKTIMKLFDEAGWEDPLPFCDLWPCTTRITKLDFTTINKNAVHSCLSKGFLTGFRHEMDSQIHGCV